MTLRNRIGITALSLAVASACVLFVLHSDSRKAVESLLRKAHEAIETENMDRLSPLISVYYRDDLGFNCPALLGAFEYVFSQYAGITVDYHITRISAGKDTVTAELTVWGRGEWAGSKLDMAGTENDPVPLTVFCRKEFFSWKIVGSLWPRGRAGLRQFN